MNYKGKAALLVSLRDENDRAKTLLRIYALYAAQDAPAPDEGNGDACAGPTPMLTLDACVLGVLDRVAMLEGEIQMLKSARRTRWAVWCIGEGWCPAMGPVESFLTRDKAVEAMARWQAENPSSRYFIHIFVQGDEVEMLHSDFSQERALP